MDYLLSVTELPEWTAALTGSNNNNDNDNKNNIITHASCFPLVCEVMVQELSGDIDGIRGVTDELIDGVLKKVNRRGRKGGLYWSPARIHPLNAERS